MGDEEDATEIHDLVQRINNQNELIGDIDKVIEGED